MQGLKTRKGQGLDHKDQDKDKDLTHKDQDKDKDLKNVLNESLRTRTRINIPGSQFGNHWYKATVMQLATA